MTQHFTDASFESEVLKSEKVVLVDFFAEWCGPCKMMAPTIDELATELDGQAVVGKMDVDENPETAQKYGVFSIPTILVFRRGEPVGNPLVGVRTKDVLLKAIKDAMAA
jgi:thioredoxin 1